MDKRISTDTINWIIIIGVILFVVEIAFFHGGVLWGTIFLGILLYVGWKNYRSIWGKIFFWIGLIGFIVSILNLIAVRFLIIVLIIMLLVDYAKSKKENNHIKPLVYIEEKNSHSQEPLIRTQPIFKQFFYGDQETDNTAYEWHDINIQGGIGDRTIDLSNTVLPNETAIVSIRHLVGNITIYIPYEVEFVIHHSAIFGRAYILNEQHHQMTNQVLSYRTKNFDTNVPRVKIITSLISGNIEVIRK